MVSSNAAPKQNETIVKIIVILIIMLTVLGAIYWTLTSQAGILSKDGKRGCNPIAFVLHGIVSKLDCLNV
ncbi:MAG TPA: hypothetical protein VF233_09105 [Nitrososphaeraceae archaeon]